MAEGNVDTIVYMVTPKYNWVTHKFIKPVKFYKSGWGQRSKTFQHLYTITSFLFSLNQPTKIRNRLNKWLVPDSGGQSLDTDPNFFLYKHLCHTIINVRNDRNAYKGVCKTNSDKDAVLWICFIKKKSWRDIGTAICINNVCFVKSFSERFKCKKSSYFHEHFEISGTTR